MPKRVTFAASPTVHILPPCIQPRRSARLRPRMLAEQNARRRQLRKCEATVQFCKEQVWATADRSIQQAMAAARARMANEPEQTVLARLAFIQHEAENSRDEFFERWAQNYRRRFERRMVKL